MSRAERGTYDRRAFIRAFMHEGGVTYTQACRLYDVMVGVFETAILTGNRVTIGRIGAIVPYWRPPRDIQMHFRRKGKKIEKGIHRTYFMDGRYDFRFRLYRNFIQTRQLKWLADMPTPESTRSKND